jgi:hypothetical protein
MTVEQPIASLKRTFSDPLIGMLQRQLGVTGDQAKGSVGSLLVLAQERLAARDFDRVAKLVPGGAIKCMDAARSLGALAGRVNNLEGLHCSLQRLGISHETAAKFVPAVLDFVARTGNHSTRNLLAGVLHQVLESYGGGALHGIEAQRSPPPVDLVPDSIDAVAYVISSRCFRNGPVTPPQIRDRTYGPEYLARRRRLHERVRQDRRRLTDLRLFSQHAGLFDNHVLSPTIP